MNVSITPQGLQQYRQHTLAIKSRQFITKIVYHLKENMMKAVTVTVSIIYSTASPNIKISMEGAGHGTCIKVQVLKTDFS